jgi:hypothetical protein
MGLFKDFINEAGKTAAEIKWIKKNKNYYGEFYVNAQKFEINVTLMDNEKADVYQFKFYRDKSTKMFNDNKYAFGVVATIKEALDYIVKTLKPDILVFAASDDSTTRKALYKLEAARIATKYDYFDITRSKDIEEAGFASDVIFGIYKNDKILQDVLSEF